MAYLGDDGRLNDVSEEDVERTKRGARALLEEGWYRCALVEDEAQPKSWGIGLAMQYQILDGTYSEQRIFDYLCVRHSRSEQAEQIARSKLKAFAIAAGAKNPNDVTDTAPLYGRPVMLRVFREADDTKYAESDGCKPRIGSIVSVAEWKDQHKDEPLPGVRNGPVPNNSPPASKQEETPPPAGDDDIPF